MEDAKLIKLHETLQKLQPRGKSGGLGFGAGFGGPKKKDDGLPKNGLYSFFVRAGEGGYKRWAEDEEPAATTEEAEAAGKEEEEEGSSSSSSSKSKKKKEKKEKRKRKRASQEEEQKEQPEAAVEEEEEVKEKKQNPQAGDEGPAADFPWDKHIKAVLKGAEGRAMPLKKLRKEVMARAADAHPDGGERKTAKKLKRAFESAVAAHGKLHVADGVVAYKKEKKSKAQ